MRIAINLSPGKLPIKPAILSPAPQQRAIIESAGDRMMVF